MNRFASLVLAATLVSCGTPDKPVDKPYVVTTTLPGPDGSYDYVSVDATTGQAFIGRSFGVMAVDLKTGVTRTVLARDGVAAVLPITGTRLMLSTNSEQNTATLFDRDTGAVTADIPTGKDPDGATFDPVSKLAFVMNGESEDVSIIDVALGKVIATVAVGGKPEGAVADGKGRLFVNIEDSNAVAVIDVATRKVVARYPLTGCSEPTGIAHDPTTGLLIAACHNNIAKLIDASSGADRGSIPICGRADGSLFDPASRKGFVPCLDGTLTVYRLDAKGSATILQNVKTREGARTAAYDAASDRLYLPAATVERDATGAYVRAARDFSLLIVAPAD